MEGRQGFWATLFDFSFTNFVAMTIITVLYWVSIILAILAALWFIIAGFQNSVGTGIIFVILSPFLFLLYVITARLWLELIAVVFRIEMNTRETARREMHRAA